MKPRKIVSQFLLQLVSSIVLTGIGSAYTVEVDPAGSIPGTYTEVYSATWDVDGDTEGWSASSQFIFNAGTPSGGQITGTTDVGTNDPNINIGSLSVSSGYDTIIEIGITKDIADTSRIDIFWGDGAGGISGDRMLSTGTPWIATSDGLAHVVRFKFSGEITGDISQFRYDMSAIDLEAIGASVSMNYFKVYTVAPPTPLDWDPGMTGSAAGGTGTWDTSATSFWNSSSQVAWPTTSSGLDEASFGGTAGLVTVAGGGITVNKLNSIAGYEFTGGTLTFDGNVPAVNATETIFNAPFAITSAQPLELNGTNNTYGVSNTFTEDANLNQTQSNLLADDAFGDGGTLTTKTGNLWFSAVDADRTISNDVVFRGNRLIINNATFGGLPSTSIGNLIIDGDFENASTATPGDLFLRRNLTINGVVSGAGVGGNALFFAGDAGTLTLNNTANTFGGGANNAIRFDVGSTMVIAADGSLGDASNYLLHALGEGKIQIQSSFDLNRDITINNSAVSVINTNGFDSTLNGIITGETGAGKNTRLYKRGAGKLTLNGAGTSTLGGGIRLEEGSIEIASGATLNHGTSVWGANPGQYGGTSLEINGGNFIVGYWGLSRTAAGLSTFTLTDGNFTNNLEFLTAVADDGVVNFDGGTANLNQFSMANGAGLTSTLNLNGTDFSLNFFNDRGGVGDEGTCIINFNGSTITAESDRYTGNGFIESEVTFVTANVQAGGAIFNTAEFDLLIVPPLLHDPALGATLDGGLTKQGTGTLLLAGASTYTGDTHIDAGCLSLDNITAIPDVTKVNVADGAAFGGIVGASNLLDADIQNIVDNTNWAVSGSFLVIDTNGADVTVAANITGDIGLIKKGDGELTLTGTNTYTGATVIEGGTIAGAGGIADVNIAKTGATEVTLTFTASGLVDVYRSSDLQTWGAAYATGQTSPYIDSAASALKLFYVLVPAGQPYPPAAP